MLTESGLTELHEASYNLDTAAVARLLRLKADATARTDQGKTPLDYVLASGDEWGDGADERAARDIIGLLVRHKASVNKAGPTAHFSPLYAAIELGRPCIIDQLLFSKADPNPPAREDDIMYHAMDFTGTIVRLLSAGADMKTAGAILGGSSALERLKRTQAEYSYYAGMGRWRAAEEFVPEDVNLEEVIRMVSKAPPAAARLDLFGRMVLLRTWARVFAAPGGSPGEGGQLQAFFRRCPGLRPQIGAKILLYYAPTWGDILASTRGSYQLKREYPLSD